jgi:hypothetical protein
MPMGAKSLLDIVHAISPKKTNMPMAVNIAYSPTNNCEILLNRCASFSYWDLYDYCCRRINVHKPPFI